MRRSFRLGHLFGMPLDIHWSFLALLAVAGVWMGGAAGVFTIIVAFGSVVLHELGHSLVAKRLNVRVAGIELFFFGGAAKMVEQPRTARDEVLIAAAGPAVSFVLAFLGLAGYAAFGVAFLQLFGFINLTIALFNLVPALPMDGGRILRGALAMRVGFTRATTLAVKVSRVFAVGFGMVGLFTMSLQLVLLAGVLWVLGSAERAASERVGGYRNDTRRYAAPSGGMPLGKAHPLDFLNRSTRPAPKERSQSEFVVFGADGRTYIVVGHGGRAS